MDSPNPSTQQEQPQSEPTEEETLTPNPSSSPPPLSSSSFPTGRIKKIVKLDQEIKKMTSEALHLISLSADLFLSSLAAAAGEAARSKKRKIVKLDHIRSAVRSHTPTSDFLLDCLPVPSPPVPAAKKSRADGVEQPLPPRTRRIDNFFQKAE